MFSALPWIILVFTLVTIGLLGSWRFLRTYPKENVRALEVAVWLAFIPILLMLLGSLWVHKLFMSVRYAVAALVPFVILIAVGLVTWADKRNKYLATIAILFYFFVSIATLSNMYQLKVKPTTSWKSIAAYLNELKPAAVAIYSPYMKLPLSIYYSGAPLVPLPEQVMGSWDKLIKVRPELVKHDSDIVLMLSHPKMYRSQYLQLFSISSHLRRLKTDFFDVELFLKPAANEAYITKR